MNTVLVVAHDLGNQETSKAYWRFSSAATCSGTTTVLIWSPDAEVMISA